MTGKKGGRGIAEIKAILLLFFQKKTIINKPLFCIWEE